MSDIKQAEKGSLAMGKQEHITNPSPSSSCNPTTFIINRETPYIIAETIKKLKDCTYKIK